jgi:hypothetical protein
MALLLPIAARAQYQGCRQLSPPVDPNVACIQLSGSNLLDNNGNKLAAGKVVLTVTNSSGTPVSYTPQGGSSTSTVFVAQVVNGQVQNISGFAFTIVNTLNASPSALVFHYQLESTDGSIDYLDVPLWNITSTTGGYSLDSFNALPGSSITGLGYPRSSCSGTAKYTPSDNPAGAKPWICSVLWRTDKSNQWTQNPSANPQCPMGQAIVSPRTGPPYCIQPENAYAMPGEGFINPLSGPGPMEVDPVGNGSGSIPHTNDILAGYGDGTAVAVPELGTTAVAGTPNTAKIAWQEDNGFGLFDARDPQYDGGIFGPTPALALQDMCNDVTCYQSTTGLHAKVVLPPGTFPIGTPANPTLTCPTGAHYESSSPNPNGMTTTLQPTYNNHLALHFMVATTATCRDGNVHTNAVTNGYYGGGIGVHGCAQGGCVNAPGDTGGYPNGGPNQVGVLVEDSAGLVDLLGSYENGASGVDVEGESTHVGTLWTANNAAWYTFGAVQSGVTYNPTTDTNWHCNLIFNSLDGTAEGPIESGGVGFLTTPGAAYGHLCGIYWGGGNTQMGMFFSNRDEIGFVRGGFTSGRSIGGRIDAPTGEGFVVEGGGNTFSSIDNSSACSGFGSTPKGTIFGPWIGSLGSGMTNGTYVVHANAGDATLTVTVAGGIATAIAVSNAGTTGEYTSTPTFTMTGTGGTPAVIGATSYWHCDKLDDAVGQNSYSQVRNIFESFFGTDHSTGDIWNLGGGVFDRSVVGSFERVTGTVNEPKGIGAHRDLLDPAQPSGGVGVTGPGPDFSQGNHFISLDTTPTNWSGPFTVGSIMQDIWIYGGNVNTTLVSSLNGGPWVTCSGYNINLGAPQWYHFFVFRDDVFFTIGTNFLFQEQCDTIDQNHWWVNHLANAASLPPLAQQGTVDSMGDIRSHAIPALAGLTGNFGGIADGVHGFAGTWYYAYRVWGPWGTQTSALAGPINQCMPAAGFVNNPCFQTLIITLPEGWTSYILTRESTTDVVATAGTISSVSFTTPQHALTQAFPDTYIAPLNSTIIGAGNYSANITGGPFECGTLPPVSAYPAVAGQRCESPATSSCYWADATDHWKKETCTYANF